jgi:hypothetical protein
MTDSTTVTIRESPPSISRARRRRRAKAYRPASRSAINTSLSAYAAQKFTVAR